MLYILNVSAIVMNGLVNQAFIYLKLLGEWEHLLFYRTVYSKCSVWLEVMSVSAVTITYSIKIDPSATPHHFCRLTR